MAKKVFRVFLTLNSIEEAQSRRDAEDETIEWFRKEIAKAYTPKLLYEFIRNNFDIKVENY